MSAVSERAELSFGEEPQTIYLDALQTGVLNPAARIEMVEEGIYSTLCELHAGQDNELSSRDAVMREHRARSPQEILTVVAKHHSYEVMSARAQSFRASFAATDWIIDVGGGTGWYWRGTRGAKIVLVDFSLETLRVAKRLLTAEDRVLLLHCDATKLPVSHSSCAGVWSVQVFQHMPEQVLSGVLSELTRVLAPEVRGEIYNLNPALLLRLIYWISGRKFVLRGTQSDYVLNRLGGEEWERTLSILTERSAASTRARISYSELFFHPNLKLIPRRYPLSVERWIARHAPFLARTFARQVQVEF